MTNCEICNKPMGKNSKAKAHTDCKKNPPAETKPKTESQKEAEKLRFRDTPPFKLKNDPPMRRFVAINLKQQFGFVPEVIAVLKIDGNNKFIIRAVLTKEEIARENEFRKKQEEKAKKELAEKNAKLDKLEKKNVKKTTD